MVRKGRKFEGFVANKLKRSKYKVKRNLIKRLNGKKKFEVDILAEKNNEKYVIEVKSGKQTLKSSDIKKLVKKSKKLRGKPLLYMSSRAKLTKNAKVIAKFYNVHIKRVRRWQ
ncbi:restriction endonuclease [Nanobdella aerobiophila]|uniref:Restriction endonuclease n=1 Tax=Nanobdella aerobiophila TaxID=2586965 RepID=A0A915SSZ3_9ARCH|nr:PmeII family type II restriction endonuclease [Nanobdella aerobiophila]BBL45741.1 restriction endonuclease [Nanobdella aerobiophila]